MAGQLSRGASLICISNKNNMAAVLNVTPWRLFKVSPTDMKCSKQVIGANFISSNFTDKTKNDRDNDKK